LGHSKTNILFPKVKNTYADTFLLFPKCTKKMLL